MKLSVTEENYLKAIYAISFGSNENVSTNAVAEKIETSPASVTDMAKRLLEKKLITYEKYRGLALTDLGAGIAVRLVRKHRIWEVFLVNKLGFKWDEVHEIAEQLEHIQSGELVDRLDEYLDHPKYDPHGDPIPDKEGNFQQRSKKLLSELKENETGTVIGVVDSSTAFLQYLNSLDIALGTTLEIKQYIAYDNSMVVAINSKRELSISSQVCNNLFVSTQS